MLIPLLPVDRPDRTLPKSKKDKAYHNRMARALVSSCNNGIISRFHKRSLRIEQAFAGRVLTEEDVDVWLMDDQKNVRNRTMFNFNMVKPIVEQYRGAAIQTEFNASYFPVTHRTRTARQNELAHRLLMHSLSEMSPEMGRMIGSKYNLGRSPEETEMIFDSTFQDRHLRAMNNLLQQLSSIAGIGKHRGEGAMRFAFSGLVTSSGRLSGSFPHFQRIHHSEFIYDTENTKSFDFSDSDFMGVCPVLGMPRIAEDYRVDKEALASIENGIRTHVLPHLWASSFGLNNSWSINSQMGTRVYSIFWVDLATDELGYVNRHGIPTLVRIGKDDYSGEEYSYNDLVEPPDTETNQKIFKGKKSARSEVECVRYCDFVPCETLVNAKFESGGNIQMAMREGLVQDLVLDYGVYPFQGYNPYDPERAVMPIQAKAYAIAGGEIISPLQAIIDPSRFTDRLLGSLEHQANLSGGRVFGIDTDLLHPDEKLDQLDIKRKNGGTVKFSAQGRGISQAFASHDDSIGSGAHALMNIVSAVQDMVRTITGVHQPMTGESQKGQLVGVTEILVQRGAMMQEGFHDSFADWIMQQYRWTGTAGKEWVLEHPDVIVDLLSPEDIAILMETRGMAAERYNAKLERDSPERHKRQAANQWLDLLLQMGMIDKPRYADLYNRSFVEDIAPAVRQYTQELARAEAGAQREAAMQKMQAAMAVRQQQLEERQHDLDLRAIDSANMQFKEGAKAQAGREREFAAAAARQEEQQAATASAFQ